MGNKSPVAFISHAREDKERFVLSFAEKLLQNGIDVWVDQWEMLPGDSLIDKIFEEGIKNADAFIVVLSTESVKKHWVREELNAGLVKRISGQCEVIPVVIDDCEIPEALQSILWEKIENLDDYRTELDRIVAAILGVSQKPNIGELPQYVELETNLVSGLSKIDTIVLKVSCEFSIENGHSFVNTENIKDDLEALGISQDQMYESIEILSENYFIDAKRELGGVGIDFFKITTYGFEQYAHSFIHDFAGMVHRVLVTVINENITQNKELSQHLGMSIAIIDYILDILENRNYFKLSKTMGGNVGIHTITASGRRAARS